MRLPCGPLTNARYCCVARLREHGHPAMRGLHVPRRRADVIAQNYRRFPEALALQMVLPWGHGLKWALPRPTTRIGRAIRAARGAAFAAAGRVIYPVKRNTPAWVRDASKLVRKLGEMVRKAQQALDFNECYVRPNEHHEAPRTVSD